MHVYTWLRSRQTVHTPSGVSYEIARFREAADEIDTWRNVAHLLDEALNAMIVRRGIDVDDLDFIHDARDAFKKVCDDRGI